MRRTHLYFTEFKTDKQFSRTYNNDWSELREYIGYNDYELEDGGELWIKKARIKSYTENVGTYAFNHNVLRIMAGLPGVAYF